MTPQLPISSGFGSTTTAAEVLGGYDLSGKVAVVTGGYAGLGLETARVLAAAGATVIVPARDVERAAKALEGIAGARSAYLDLMNPGSIDLFAETILAAGHPLHMLINSAGIMANPLTRDARGFESQLATNHLGHFQLTARLWPALQKARGARIVSLSSRGHRLAGVDFDDPNFERRAYDPWIAYGQSKTANALFALKLDQRGQAENIRAFSVHPGTILTDLARHMSAEQLRAQGALDDEGRPIVDPSRGMKSIAQGAATSVWCATSAQLEGRGGVYCEDCDVAVAAPAASDKPYGVRPWATNPEFADRLWSLSERLTGVTFADWDLG